MGSLESQVELTESLKNYPNLTKMQLFIQGSTQCYNIDVSTEAEFINFLESKESNMESITLSVNGAPVEAFEDLTDGNTVQVSHKLLGGKVHGSLARAGKVKGQTPKVEAAEKKKAKTGRAKRRLQYNRRFVTESNTFGKKKGPNTQMK